MNNIFSRIKKLYKTKHIVKSFTIKNFKGKYVGSIMGISWAIITPLLLAGVISIIFTKILQVKMNNFPLFVLSGFLPWLFFSRALSESTNSIVENVNLLNQFRFPREIIPLSTILSNFLSFFIGFIAILPIFIFFKPNVVKYIWCFPLVFAIFLLFTCGVSLLLSSLNVLTRDVAHLLEIGLLFWFWMTPVFYSVQMVPDSFRFICYLNPLTLFMIMFHNILYHAEYPQLKIFIFTTVLSLLVAILGYRVFISLSPNFLKRI